MSLIVFSAIAVAFSGGFIMIWLYRQEWFLNFSVFEQSIREIMNVNPINLSVAVWVGFLALFGIATDDGVLIASLIKQQWEEQKPKTLEEIREVIVSAGKLRVRPAMMTTATTLLALLPVLTSTGRTLLLNKIENNYKIRSYRNLYRMYLWILLNRFLTSECLKINR